MGKHVVREAVGNVHKMAIHPLPLEAAAKDALKALTSRFERSHRQVAVEFRTLVNWIRLGDQFTHQIHPYPAKLLPHIASLFVRSFGTGGRTTTVLDPFCGSGTVALEASLAQCKPMVADANPLALLVTKAKTTPYDPDQLRESVKTVLRRAERFRTAPIVPIVNAHLWYAPQKKKELEILLRAVNEIDDLEQRDFLRVCFSVTARRLSWADPRISVPVRLRTKRILDREANERIRERLTWLASANALKEFAAVCEANIERVRTANLLLPTRKPALVVGTDARHLQGPHGESGQAIDDGSVDLIVTSPPYGAAQKYIRATSLSLNWLGLAGPKELASLESSCIGREHLPARRKQINEEALPKSYERLLGKIYKVNEKRAAITRTYLTEMKAALVEMARVVSKDGRIVVVIGNNQVCGNAIRNDEYVARVFEEQGLHPELRLVDSIKSRGLMTKRNKTASVISRESVLVFSR